MPYDKKSAAYIAHLLGQRAEYVPAAKDYLAGLYKNDNPNQRPPEAFVEDSFLYIRSYPGDGGGRPFSGMDFWNSPDIRVAPVNNLGAYTRDLQAGTTYELSCTVRNAGDLHVPSAKVEFFLTDPSLGFDTRFATHLGAAAAWVEPLGSATVRLNYTVPPALGGHRCLFARVFAFSPYDVPFDPYSMNPTLDRHVGQLNLNIVAQSSTFRLNWVHLPQANEALEVVALTERQLRTLQHPVVNDFRFTERIPVAQFAQMLKPAFIGRAKNVQVKPNEKGFTLRAESDKGFSPQAQAQLHREVMEAWKNISAGKAKRSRFKELFRAWEDMNRFATVSALRLRIPHMGLEKGEAAAFHFVNRSLDTGEVRGGIAFVMVAS